MENNNCAAYTMKVSRKKGEGRRIIAAAGFGKRLSRTFETAFRVSGENRGIIELFCS
jgi:hypothetical protein